MIAFVQSWTPDGQDLLYTRWSNDVEWRKRREELWRVAVAGGPPRSMGLVVPGMREVRLSPDGRRLAFTAGQETLEVWAVQGFEHELPAARN